MTSNSEKFKTTPSDNGLPVFRRVLPLPHRDYKVIQIKDEDQRIKMIIRATPAQRSSKFLVRSQLAGLKRGAPALGQWPRKRKKLFASSSRESYNKLDDRRERPNGVLRRKRPTPEESLHCQPKRPCLSDRDSDAVKPVSETDSAWLSELGLRATDIEILDSGEWLTDDHISAALRLLRRQFPALAGLQNPILGEILQFQPMTSDGVQVVLSGGGHWVTVCKTEGAVKLLDSENVGLSPKLSSQIVNLFGGQDHDRGRSTAGLEVCLPKMHPQRGSSDCGVFALAYAAEVAFGGCPESVVFDQKTMRQHLKNCLMSLKMTPFPKMNCSPRTVKVVGTKSEMVNY